MLIVLFVTFGFSAVFLLMAGLRWKACGFYFADPAMLDLVQNIVTERQRRGDAWSSRMGVAETLRRIYLCAAVFVVFLVLGQLVLGY